MGIRKVGFTTIPCMLLLMTFAPYLVAILGGLDAEDAMLTATYLQVQSLALPFYGVSTYLQKVCSSLMRMKIYMVASVVAAVIQVAFCIVLIYQFTSFIMESKRGEIGILRALGAGKRDIVILFLMQSLLLSLLQAAGGAVVMLALVPSVNAVVSSGVNAQIVFLRFSFVAFVIELAVSVVVTALSALLPIAKVAKMSPVDAIRRNEI